MIRQQIKDLLFTINRFAVLPNTLAARIRYRRSGEPEGLYLHLGCGANYIPGMINIDGNAMRKIDLWLDFRNPLPFADASAEFIYCSHTLEHLFPDDALKLLREMRRVLKPQGVARLAVPSMEHALRIARGESSMPFPRPFEDPLAQAVNYLFCDGQHRFGYSYSLLADFARQCGFTRMTDYSAASGVTPKQYGKVLVGNEPEGSLVVEFSP